MIRHHQDSLLLRYAQGEVSHETAATTRYLVCTDSVPHTADIHLPDPVSPVRSPAKGRKTGGCCNSGLRVRQEVVQHIVLIYIYTKPTIPLVVAYRGRQSWQRLCLEPLEQCSLVNIASVNRERN